METVQAGNTGAVNSARSPYKLTSTKNSNRENAELDSDQPGFDQSLTEAVKATSKSSAFSPAASKSIEDILASSQSASGEGEALILDEEIAPQDLQGLILGTPILDQPDVLQQEKGFKPNFQNFVDPVSEQKDSAAVPAEHYDAPLPRTALSLDDIQSQRSEKLLQEEISLLEKKNMAPEMKSPEVPPNRIKNFSNMILGGNPAKALGDSELKIKSHSPVFQYNASLNDKNVNKSIFHFANGLEANTSKGNLSLRESQAEETAAKSASFDFAGTPRENISLPTGENTSGIVTAGPVEQQVKEFYEKGSLTKKEENNQVGTLTGAGLISALDSTTSSSQVEASQALAKTDETSLTQQVMGKVKMMVSEDKNQVTIQLNPEHLGKMDVRLVKEGGQITAHITVENAEAKTLLEGQFSQLHKSMENEGIQIQQMNIDVREDPSGPGFAFSENQNGNQKGSSESKSGSSGNMEIDDGPVHVNQQISESSVNIYA